MELDDCGRELHLSLHNHNSPYDNGLRGVDVVAQMVIKAPRGTMVLFNVYGKRKTAMSEMAFTDRRCEAIRAFMREHQHDQAKENT